MRIFLVIAFCFSFSFVFSQCEKVKLKNICLKKIDVKSVIVYKTEKAIIYMNREDFVNAYKKIRSNDFIDSIEIIKKDTISLEGYKFANQDQEFNVRYARQVIDKLLFKGNAYIVLKDSNIIVNDIICKRYYRYGTGANQMCNVYVTSSNDWTEIFDSTPGEVRYL